uniref:Doublecortin domain containing 2B n=1 Tax=Salvator merianae TaxID=96440 RepID=A0A8D0BT24_SALMN
MRKLPPSAKPAAMETSTHSEAGREEVLRQPGFAAPLCKPTGIFDFPFKCGQAPFPGQAPAANPDMATVAAAPPAKNVVVYRNGDSFFQGRKFVVSQRRFLTFEAFLNEVTSTIQAPVAVRSIYTPRQGHRVTSLGELQNGYQYVAAGFERFKGLDYLNLAMKQLNEKRKKIGLPNYPTPPQKMSVSAQWKRQANLPCIIHVFRNGDLLSPPFRLILTKTILQEWNTVLSLLSEKANLRSGAVKKLCKLNGDAVGSGEDLVSGDYYVAVGLEKYKNLPYFELLVPPKIVHRPFRNLPNRWRNHNRGLNIQRVQSTGSAQKENNPNSPVGESEEPRKYLHKDEDKSIFRAKPVQFRKNSRNSYQSSGQDENSVYKMKGPREELQDAQEIREDENTQVELPVDQKAAETVEEEVTLQTKLPPHREKKLEHSGKLREAHIIRQTAGDLGQEVTRKPRKETQRGSQSVSEGGS